MRDYIEVGPVPSDEDCAQVGRDDYGKMWKECRIFRDQLLRQLGEPPIGARFAIKRSEHDFGAYCEVVCHYDTDYPDSVEYAYRAEGECPENWDKKALLELKCTCDNGQGQSYDPKVKDCPVHKDKDQD